MKRDMTMAGIRRALAPDDDLEALQHYYILQIGQTFTAAIYLEQRIVTAMLTCDRIRLSTSLDDDVPAFLNAPKRHVKLSNSTLGNLIAILSKHGIDERDLAYLRWIKKKRDYFIHRFFIEEPWPVSLPEHGLRFYSRRLRYLELIFGRATSRIYSILARAGLIVIRDLGKDGALICNVGCVLDEDGDSWLEQMTVAMVRRRAKRKRREAREDKAVRLRQRQVAMRSQRPARVRT
jgi:hypothetical protein